ncbi:MAG: hypothetical protein ABIH28_02555 [archaeon]
MVSINVLSKMNKYFKEKFQNYCENHPGEFVLIEECERGHLKESFYKSQKELYDATKKYRNLLGPTCLVQQIPLNPDDGKESGLELKLIKNCASVSPP